MTLQKRCWVRACARWHIDSSHSLAAGEINAAKSASVARGFARTSPTLFVVADNERFRNVSSGSSLNLATKLMRVPYQKRRQRQGRGTPVWGTGRVVLRSKPMAE